MKSLIITFALICFPTFNAYSYGGLLDSIINYKDHDYCLEVAKKIRTDQYTRTEWYDECRLQLELFGNFNWKYQYMKQD